MSREVEVTHPSWRFDAESLEALAPKLAFYDRFLPADRGARVFDYGCGSGAFLFYLRRQGYRNYVGADPLKVCVDFVRAHFGEEAGVLLEPGEAGFFEERAGSFDRVVMRDVIEHIERAEVIDTLRGLHTLLAPGGQLLVETNNCSLPVGMHIQAADITHVTPWNASSLEQALGLAGFSEITFHPKPDFYDRQRRGLSKLAYRAADAALRRGYRLMFELHGMTPPPVLTNRIIALATR